MADGRRGRQQLEELSPAAASLAVSVITVTVLLTVIAHGASAEPLARRYGAAAGPGTNGDHGLPRAGLSTNLSFPEIAGGMFLSRTMIKSQAMSVYRRLGACSRSQAVTRSRLLGLLEAGRPVFHPIRRMEPAPARCGLVPTASGGPRTRARV
jgi:hypothetical protein